METTGIEITLTLKGKNLMDLVGQAESFIEGTGKVTAQPKARKGKAAPAEVVEEQLDLGSTEETMDFTGEVEEPAKEAKAKKLTDKDVNDACMAFAKANGKAKTMAILAKFKVKSILELKPETYGKVIAALEV